MKYSVIIPLYNKEHYIVKTIQSVLRQKYQDYEIIVVDDGSTDASLHAARSINDSRIEIIKQRNQGVSVARNTGITRAKGEYIAFLDADDEWHEDYLDTVDDLTCRYPESDIFVTAYEVKLKGDKCKHSCQLQPEAGCLGSYWTTLKKGYDFVWTSATVVKKDALIAAGGFVPGENIGQDLDVWAKVARNNPKVAYSSKICVTYNREAESNARSRVRIAHAGAFIRVLEEEMENAERTKKELDAICAKYDKKMTVSIFTGILAGDKEHAKRMLGDWKGPASGRKLLLRTGLRIAMCLPSAVNRFAYQIRLRVF